MIRTSRSVDVVTWTSSARPATATEDESLAPAIEWGDASPVAYRIVTETRSAVFGRGSLEFFGFYRDGKDPDSVLRRLDHLRLRTLESGIHGWRARFTVAHYGDPGFRGDLFRLWDGEHSRSRLVLDHTPATIEEVLDQFTAWCDPHYKKVDVRVGERVVRRFGSASVAEEVDPLS